MSLARELLGMVMELQNRLAALEQDLARTHYTGAVSDVDPVKGLRIDLGTDPETGEQKKSPWLPINEHAGKFKAWVPPTVGQTVTAISSIGGDPRKAIVVRAGYGGEFEPPSQSLDENVFVYGAVKITIKEDSLKVEVGRSSIELKDKDIVIKARRIYGIGKVAMGVDSKVFPTKVETTAGAAKKFFSTILGEDIPDDD